MHSRKCLPTIALLVEAAPVRSAQDVSRRAVSGEPGTVFQVADLTCSQPPPLFVLHEGERVGLIVVSCRHRILTRCYLEQYAQRHEPLEYWPHL